MLIIAIVGVVGWTELDAWQRDRIFSVESESRRWWSEPPAGTEIFDLSLSNGDKVRAWYWQAPRADAPTVLYLHGSRWNLNGSAFRMRAWTALDVSVLAIDYRGFGESTPLLPSEQSAAADARAALDELARRQPNPALRFVYGHSLGGAVAIDVVAEQHTPPIAGLIIEASFTSIADMLGTLKWGAIPGLKWLITQPFASIDKVAGLQLPMLFIHGTGDRVVPHTMSDQLYDAAVQVPPGLKHLLKIDGGSHSGGVRAGLPYETAVNKFILAATQYWQQKSVQLRSSR